MFSGLSEAEFQAAPTTTPSAASPASCISCGLLNPLPPMIGTSSPTSRAWLTSGIAASIRPETTIASGSAPAASVSSGRKSVSLTEKVSVFETSTPSASSESANTSYPDSVNASSLLYITTTSSRPNSSVAAATVCGMTWPSVRESRKM